MIYYAGCKINLGLSILGKRQDGYHNLETVFYPVPWNDIIEIVPSMNLVFTTSGLEIDGNPEDNLIMKAYNLVAANLQIPPVKIHLHKQIPFGAGLGGGSSDAVAALILLNKLFNLNLSDSQFHHFASLLGADCPFFIHNRPVFASGIGTSLSPISIDLSGLFLLIIKPEVYVSTALAYGLITGYSTPGRIQSIISQPVESWKSGLINDFQEPIFNNFPQLKTIYNSFYDSGALYASMSGSGSAIYGLYSKRPNLDFCQHLEHKLISL